MRNGAPLADEVKRAEPAAVGLGGNHVSAGEIQNASCSRVKKAVSLWRVTVAGGARLTASRPPPVKVVCEKLVSRRTFLLSHQLMPTDQDVAPLAELSGFAKP